MNEELKIYLKNNYEVLLKLLKYFDYKDINRHDNEIRCAKPNGSNSSTIRIKLNDYVSADDFSSAYKGDIIGLISKHSDMTYGEVVNIINSMINKKIEKKKKDRVVFGGFFNDSEIEREYELKVYNKSILKQYDCCWNVRFLKDNILPSTQIKFNIGYDIESKRITIPWFDFDGNLIGIMGRINFDETSKYKYLPLIAFPKQLALYGIYQNKEFIKNNRVYIFESEKSVLQAHGYGYRNCVALGGNVIHDSQINQLLKLNVKEFILCFDEGLDNEIIKKSVLNIKNNLVMRDEIKVGIMIDNKHKYINEGSKNSPTDLGKEIWIKLIEECVLIGGINNE